MRRTETAVRTGDMVRRAAGWHAPRPSDEDLRDLAELVVRGRPLAVRSLPWTGTPGRSSLDTDHPQARA